VVGLAAQPTNSGSLAKVRALRFYSYFYLPFPFPFPTFPFSALEEKRWVVEEEEEGGWWAYSCAVKISLLNASRSDPWKSPLQITHFLPHTFFLPQRSGGAGVTLLDGQDLAPVCPQLGSMENTMQTPWAKI
jgi:hypothetical protein